MTKDKSEKPKPTENGQPGSLTPGSKISAIKSAALNIGTAARASDAALECWDDENWSSSVMWINNAIAELESARTKITVHAYFPNAQTSGT